MFDWMKSKPKKIMLIKNTNLIDSLEFCFANHIKIEVNSRNEVALFYFNNKTYQSIGVWKKIKEEQFITFIEAVEEMKEKIKNGDYSNKY